MTQQGPWSVKGIDPKARSIARDRAQRQGVTLGQYLNSLLLEDDAGLIEDVQIAETTPRGANAGDLRRMSSEIDLLSRKLEEAQARSARAVSGLDKSILSLMGKMETSGKAQLGALERMMRAMTEIESTQTALRSRIDTLEADRGAGPTLDALKTLETSLDHLANTLQERVGVVEKEQTEFRSLFDEKVDSFTRSIDQAVTSAIRNTAGNISGRVEQIEEQMSTTERRMEGALGRITDAASRFEAFETKAERAITDTSWKMERALETNLNRSRQMSKEVLERVESIEEKTREAVNNLSDAVSRITDRLSRAERKTDTAFHVLERSVSEIDEKFERGGGRGPSAQDFEHIQALFQKRLDSLAEDLSRPIHALRADVEKRLEEALRSGTASPERMERLERALRQVQDHAQISEARQADAVEAMSGQVERLSRAVDERLRAIETRGDARSIEDVRREMLKLADTIDARIGGAMDAVRNDIGRLNTSVDDRMQALEKGSAAALDAVGEQVAIVAERLQKRHDESIKHLNTRIDETRVESRQLDSADIDRLADRLDERVKESERRSAEAIGQIGEQVARVADRLQNQQIESVRMFETRLADSGRSHEARLNSLMEDMQRRMDELGEQSHAKLGPVHKTISSIARRLESVEDAPKRAKTPIFTPPETPAPAEDFVILEDVGPAAELVDEGSSGIVGVDPPPFDTAQDAELFTETPRGPDSPEAEPVRNVEDLLETDDVVLAPKTETPARDSLLDGGPSAFLAHARRAARENRGPAAAGRKGIGKGPLIASAALAVAVAGGGVLTVMRGKQEARADDFAKLDPASPMIAAPGASAEADLFGDGAMSASPAPSAREPAAGELFDAPAAGAEKGAAQKPAASPVITLEQAVRNGDPVALYDHAVELLQSGEKQRAVQMLKEAAGRGLVMAEYRLAKLYEKGEGVPRDMAAARSWTEKAAIGGNVKAMHDLAVFYAEGDAGPQSYAAAVEWFRQASDLGLVDSQYNLAVLYEQGLGLTQDRSEAAFWFEVAGRAGDQDGARRARAMLSDLPAAQADQIKRRARTFTPKAPIARANGELGQRPWDTASPTQVAEVQRLLEQLGYSPGPADGKVSAATQHAIRAFEADNELALTGQPSVTLLRHLRTSLNTAN
jgi:localization factor PodJL